MGALSPRGGNGVARRKAPRAALLGGVAVLCAGLFAAGFLAAQRLFTPGCAQAGRTDGGAVRLHVTGPGAADRIADPEAYRLRLWGKVEKELSLTLDEVKALPSVETDAPLACVVGWEDHALWRGVPVRDVVALAGPQEDGRYLTFRDDETFSSSLSMEYVLTGRPLLAYEVNGRELPRIHGWPLRVVAPGKWGYKWVKWVTEIEVTDRGYEGSYERMGFSLDGDADGPKLEAERR